MSAQPAITDPRSPAVTPGTPRLPILKALTSVRFFAALHVALYHLVRPFTQWGLLAAAMGAGYSGVSFFFVLSGFILTYSHAAEFEAGRGNFKKFFVARFARIYPVYFLAMLVSAVVYASQFRSPIHIVAYIADLLLVQAWSMRMINFFNTNGWTLSCEAFFYVVFPFILMAIRPSTRTRAIAWMALFFALAMAAPLICMKLYPTASWAETFTPVPGDGIVFTINRLPILALPEFLAGMSLGWFYLRFKPTPKTTAQLALLGVVTLAVALIFADRLPYVAIHNGLLFPFYAILMLGLTQSNWISAMLSGKLLVLLGEASYAFYLIHSISNTVAQQMGVGETIREACITLPIVIVLSVVIHLYVERPARRYILAWWATRERRRTSL
jgi:peptidoglycan/LPS O-acetylase OafA/YrhL